MSQVVRRALSVAVIVALAGCNGDASGPDQPELTGNWAGRFTNAVLGQGHLTLTLSQDSDGSLTGNWSLTGDDGNREGTVAGSHHYPDVLLALEGDSGTLLYTGQTDSNDRIRGFLNISASRIQLELRRVER